MESTVTPHQKKQQFWEEHLQDHQANGMSKEETFARVITVVQ